MDIALSVEIGDLPQHLEEPMRQEKIAVPPFQSGDVTTSGERNRLKIKPPRTLSHIVQG